MGRDALVIAVILDFLHMCTYWGLRRAKYARIWPCSAL